jgi:hypothetical protein
MAIDEIEALISKNGSITAQPLMDLIVTVVLEAVEAEREACAIACEAEGERFKHHPSGRRDFSICAAAIRARGET